MVDQHWIADISSCKMRINRKAFIPVLWCYAMWTIWCLIMVNQPELQDSDNIWRSIVRIAVVLIPGIYWLRKSNHAEEINKHQRGMVVGIIIALAIATSSLVLQIGLLGMQYTVPRQFTSWLNWIILSPIAEEILFRGIVFQELKKTNHWIIAALISSILFVGLHLPTLILIDQKSSFEIATYCFQLLTTSLLFTYAVHKAKSLWASIIPHWMNNFIAMGLVG